MSSIVPTNSIAQAIIDLSIQLQANLPRYERLIAHINTRLGVECPVATDPLSKARLQEIWEAYRLALRSRQETATATRDLLNRVAVDLTKVDSPESFTSLSADLLRQLEPLQAEDKDQAEVCDYLALRVIELVEKAPIPRRLPITAAV